MSSNRRKRKLIDPRFQLRLASLVSSAALAAVAFQAVLMTRMLRVLSEEAPHDGQLIEAFLHDTVWIHAGLSLIVLVPVFLLLTLSATFRFAGPLYRIRKHLEAVAAGENPGPCNLRDGDELQDVCDLINKVTAAGEDAAEEGANPVATAATEDTPLEDQDSELEEAPTLVNQTVEPKLDHS